MTHWFCKRFGHRWRFYRDDLHSYTGYLERCDRCGEIQQVPQ